MSLRALAAQAGVSAMALSKYERGLMKPSPEVLQAIAAALGVDAGHFTDESPLELRGVEYRARNRMTPVSKRLIHDAVRRQLAARRDIEAVVPEIQTESLTLPRLPKQIGAYAEIEGVAQVMRRAWDLRIHPIANMNNLLEAHGVCVVQVGTRDGWFDGLACRVDESPVVVVSADWPGDRQRFTLAHELGHLVLAGRLASGLDEERACNRFAGAFLAPQAAVEQLETSPVISAVELIMLKHEWGLSMAAWIYRLHDVGRIDEATFRELWRQFRRNGWNTNEPGPPLPKEIATTWQRKLYSLVANGRIGVEQAAEAMGIEEGELRGLLNFE